MQNAAKAWRQAPFSFMSAERKRRWRDYRAAAVRRPIKEFIDGLSDIDAAAVVAAMKDVTGLQR
jgi:hypothetical protein